MTPKQIANIAESLVIDYYRKCDPAHVVTFTADSLLGNPFSYVDSEFSFVKLAAQAIIEGTDIIQHSTFEDTDGKVYKTVILGGYEIMAEPYRKYSDDSYICNRNVFYKGNSVYKIIPDGWSSLDLLDGVFYSIRGSMSFNKKLLFVSYLFAAKYFKLNEFGLNIHSNGYVDYTLGSPIFKSENRMAYFITDFTRLYDHPRILYMHSFLDTMAYADFDDYAIEHGAFEVRFCRKVDNN